MLRILALLALASVAVSQDCVDKVEGGYQYTCQEDEDGYKFSQATGCVDSATGEVKAAGATWSDNFFKYSCTLLEDSSVGLERIGCISDGNEVEAGGKVQIGEYLHECKLMGEEGWQYLALLPSGCSVDGAEVPIGETFDIGGFWYTCLGEPLVKKIEGCMTPDNERIGNGETYFKDGFVVSCMCDDSSCKHQVTGCEGVIGGESVAKSVGEEWMQGVAPFEYKMKCTTCSQGTTIVKTVPECNADGTKLLPGCLGQIGGRTCGCGINAEQTLQIICGAAAATLPFNTC